MGTLAQSLSHRLRYLWDVLLVAEERPRLSVTSSFSPPSSMTSCSSALDRTFPTLGFIREKEGLCKIKGDWTGPLVFKVVFSLDIFFESTYRGALPIE